MLKRLARTLFLAAVVVVPATAQTYDGSPDDRYTVVEIADGVLRIDRETGVVSTCREQARGWVCLTAADERAALEAEIERLSAQNKDLADRIAVLRRRLTAAERQDETGDKPSGSDLLRYFNDPPPLSKKDEEDLGKFLGVTEKAFRGFFGVMRELERELKSDEDGAKPK